MQQQSQQTQFIRLPRVREIVGGVGASTIWNWVKRGEFPQPIKLSANTTAWDLREVDAWARQRIAATRQAKG